MPTHRLRAERLQAAAAARGDHSAYAIARRTGLSQSAISRLRRGIAAPATRTLLILADTYGLRVEDLVVTGTEAAA
ncbi:helix-turn-helix domain-containing protein [Streptomyces youssoufiensis]